MSMRSRNRIGIGLPRIPLAPRRATPSGTGRHRRRARPAAVSSRPGIATGAGRLLNAFHPEMN